MLWIIARKTPSIRSDQNHYSIPHTHVQKQLTVFADHRLVRIVAGTHLLAEHARSDDQGEVVEDPKHIEALIEVKKKARPHRAIDRLVGRIPLAETFLSEAAKAGYALKSILRGLEDLLDRHETGLLERAMAEALERGVPHLNAVQITLDRLLEEARKEPPLWRSI